MSDLRVALVSLHTSPLANPGSGDAGGLNVYVVALGEALARQGVEVELITRSSSEDQPATEYTAGGLPVRFLKAGPPRVVQKEEVPAVIGRFQSALAELPRFDVLHSHYWLSGLAALPVAVMESIPHIQTLHTVGAVKNAELPPGDEPEPESRLNGERLLVAKSLTTIVSTSAEQDALIELYGAQEPRIRIIEPGVDGALFHPLSGLPGPARPFLVQLGRLQPLKGHDLSIRALALLPEHLRPDLVIAGSATPGQEHYATGLAELAASLGVASRVNFTGTQSRAQSAALLREASLVLMPSHSETFGLVALEAAASGTPVIAFDTSGLRSSVADGVSGILLASRQPSDWAAAIGALLEHPATLRRLSNSAAKFGARHTWEKTAKATLRAYRSAVSASTTTR
ncbi:glycosyltransferase [Subtercola sp. RTI3]|uniref:glycosyltransferase n=1 Tax=Subtercola sp. RTI3 TaxID=3048639 RepID=UPI002B22F304|nr:glycosyltransferase [Subtercola sp. RTI3]MEA9985372.1 glycosyltransferase [Subtercola sp. RTI3]